MNWQVYTVCTTPASQTTRDAVNALRAYLRSEYAVSGPVDFARRVRGSVSSVYQAAKSDWLATSIDTLIAWAQRLEITEPAPRPMGRQKGWRKESGQSKI